MKKLTKTNAARLLDQAHVPYELIPYEVDESNLAADHVAHELGEDIRCVFKTLVLRGERSGHFVCVVPGCDEVDLKKAARVSGNKKVDLIAMKDLLPVTGYICGGCSPIGMKKFFSTFLDETAMLFDTILFSGGRIGFQVEMNPEDLRAVIPFEYADLCD